MLGHEADGSQSVRATRRSLTVATLVWIERDHNDFNDCIAASTAKTRRIPLLFFRGVLCKPKHHHNGQLNMPVFTPAARDIPRR